MKKTKLLVITIMTFILLTGLTGNAASAVSINQNTYPVEVAGMVIESVDSLSDFAAPDID